MSCIWTGHTQKRLLTEKQHTAVPFSLIFHLFWQEISKQHSVDPATSTIHVMQSIPTALRTAFSLERHARVTVETLSPLILSKKHHPQKKKKETHQTSLHTFCKEDMHSLRVFSNTVNSSAIVSQNLQVKLQHADTRYEITDESSKEVICLKCSLEQADP